MTSTRVIPVLTLINEGLYRTIKFKSPLYVGDPLNSIKLFNEKEVDELVILDIGSKSPLDSKRISYLSLLSSRAFMPVAYGGKIETLKQARELFRSGFEKLVFNTSFFKTPSLISTLAKEFGTQAIVVSIDVKNNFWGTKKVLTKCGTEKVSIDYLQAAKQAEMLGAGELYIRSIDHDGLMLGYDYELTKEVSSSVSIPVVAMGGAGNIEHFSHAMACGAHAVAAGSMFVYQGKRRGVLINYPSPEDLKRIRKNCNE